MLLQVCFSIVFLHMLEKLANIIILIKDKMTFIVSKAASAFRKHSLEYIELFSQCFRIKIT